MECRTCKETKSIGSFSFKDRKSNRQSTQCKACDKVYQEERKRLNPELVAEQIRKAQRRYYTLERRRAKSLKMYGITQVEYDEMARRQKGKCACCEEQAIQVIDHCHRTLKVRGLLCQSCNIGLGWIDNSEWLNKALKYQRRGNISNGG